MSVGNRGDKLDKQPCEFLLFGFCPLTRDVFKYRSLIPMSICNQFASSVCQFQAKPAGIHLRRQACEIACSYGLPHDTIVSLDRGLLCKQNVCVLHTYKIEENAYAIHQSVCSCPGVAGCCQS